jgi:phosphoribosylformylglycinamidine synthase PurS subunit
MNATIIVTPKASVFDPQGDALRKALEGQGLEGVQEAHVGRYIRLEISPQYAAAARKRLPALCRDFLSNPVVEDFQLLGGSPGQPTKAHLVFAAGEEMAGSLVGKQAVEAGAAYRKSKVKARKVARPVKKSVKRKARKLSRRSKVRR